LDLLPLRRIFSLRMRLTLIAGLLSCGVLVWGQAADSNVALEAAAVKAEMARSLAALRHYTWTEQTDVLQDGDVKSTSQATCRYDASGQLIKTPLAGTEQKQANPASNRPSVRKKAAKQDYIERAVSRIGRYLPPNPEQVQYALNNGLASLEPASEGRSAIRIKDYFQTGDSVVFTYDPKSKVLLQVNVFSDLANPKDPVTMEAVFETLPDGVNHLASTTLNASAKKVQIKTRNMMYEKLPE
jgi:hypothetical protein